MSITPGMVATMLGFPYGSLPTVAIDLFAKFEGRSQAFGREDAEEWLDKEVRQMLTPPPSRPIDARDQFAMAALTGLLSNRFQGPKNAAEIAYDHANAMLAAREVKS